MKLTFCTQPQCNGLDCPGVNRWAGHRSMGLTQKCPTGTAREYIWKIFAQELAIGAPTLADGTQYLTPLDAEFEIHRMADEGDEQVWSAYYSGEPVPMDLVAAGTPFSEENHLERGRLMHQTPMGQWCVGMPVD